MNSALRPLHSRPVQVSAVVVSLLAVCFALLASAEFAAGPRGGPHPPNLLAQSQAEADRKSAGCITCHVATDSATMHPTGTVRLGCGDCHGGKFDVHLPAGPAPGSPLYEETKSQAHARPSQVEFAGGEESMVRPYTRWLRENLDYVRFVNPGDLRVAPQTCGASGCHAGIVRRVQTSMMTHGGMLWGAALYNNGAFPLKDPHFGESYSAEGRPQELRTVPPPSPEDTRRKGVLPQLSPLPRWEVSQPGNVLRTFERGGRRRAETGNPTREEEPGRPDNKVAERGFGTLLRTDPVFLGLQKTRLLDPLLSLPGSNDHPGDYRHSG